MTSRSMNIQKILLVTLLVIVATCCLVAYAHHCKACVSNKKSSNVIWKLHYGHMSHIRYNITEVVHREYVHLLKKIRNETRHIRKIIVNVTQLIETISNYTNATVVFKHGIICHLAKLLFKKAIVLFNESSTIENSTLEAINTTLFCHGKCIMRHVKAIMNNSRIVAELLVLENTTFRCHNCTIVGHVVFGNGTRVIIVNPNMTLANVTCRHCRYMLTKYMTKMLNATINSTKAWIALGRLNALLHNHTIEIEVETPGANVTINIVTKWCIDNLTLVEIPVCVNKSCVYKYMNYLTCRPKIEIHVETKRVNVTIYHGFYDVNHKIVVAVNSTSIVAYRVHPAPGVTTMLIVNASSGDVSTIMIRNVTKPVAVGYVRLVINKTVTVKNVTMLPYVDPSLFPRCKLCWTYINTTKTVLIHVVHHSPVGVVVFSGKEEMTMLMIPLIIMTILLIVAFALAIAIAIRFVRKGKQLTRY